jgi:DNA-directed RNA polymerase specialized sigma24 family protein
MRTLGWWATWQRRRDIEDWRAWHGRERTRRVYASIDRPIELEDGAISNRADLLLPPTQFEDQLLENMDFRQAWPRLSPDRQKVLALTAAGLSDPEIAEIMGKATNAVAVQRSQPRRILRALCAVVI